MERDFDQIFRKIFLLKEKHTFSRFYAQIGLHKGKVGIKSIWLIGMRTMHINIHVYSSRNRSLANILFNIELNPLFL